MFSSYIRSDVGEKINPQEATREGFGQALVQLGKENEKVVVLCADLAESTRVHYFKEQFPHRYIEMGVSEQSMASVASGMASMGAVPFIASYAMFSPGRNWEQIRTTVCYNNQPVKIVGAHAGISVGPDGGTHQAIEDIALMRVIPRMTVLTPCDSVEAQKATRAAAEHNGPVYIRLAREKTPIITKDETPFAIGKILPVYVEKNAEVLLLSCGSILGECIEAIGMFREKNIAVSLIHIPTVKPLDPDLVQWVRKSSRVVVVEEHQKAGGCGSSVIEEISQYYPRPVLRIGIDDVFGQSGEPRQLLDYYGLSAKHIFQKTEAYIKKG